MLRLCLAGIFGTVRTLNLPCSFRLKTLHFEQFWTAFGNPSKGKTPERPFWNPTNSKTNYIHLFNLFHFFHPLGPTCSQPGPRTQVIVCYAFVWPEFSAPLRLKIFHVLLGSKPCILNSFGLLLETPRRGKLPNVPSEILLTIKIHLFNLFHVFHLLGPTCSQPGPRTQVIVCYAFVWPKFSAPLGLKIFHFHTLRLKDLHCCPGPMGGWSPVSACFTKHHACS